MPIFEYQCDDCGTKFEKLVRSSENGVACPSCGDSHLTQQYSTFAAHGSGDSDFGSGGDFDMGGDMPSCAGGMCQTPDLCGRN